MIKQAAEQPAFVSLCINVVSEACFSLPRNCGKSIYLIAKYRYKMTESNKNIRFCNKWKGMVKMHQKQGVESRMFQFVFI